MHIFRNSTLLVCQVTDYYQVGLDLFRVNKTENPQTNRKSDKQIKNHNYRPN